VELTAELLVFVPGAGQEGGVEVARTGTYDPETGYDLDQRPESDLDGSGCIPGASPLGGLGDVQDHTDRGPDELVGQRMPMMPRQTLDNGVDEPEAALCALIDPKCLEREHAESCFVAWGRSMAR
jgi:hypothetical protein